MGVVQVSFVITDGQYSLNKKETSDDNEIVGEEGLSPLLEHQQMTTALLSINMNHQRDRTTRATKSHFLK